MTIDQVEIMTFIMCFVVLGMVSVSASGVLVVMNLFERYVHGLNAGFFFRGTKALILICIFPLAFLMMFGFHRYIGMVEYRAIKSQDFSTVKIYLYGWSNVARHYSNTVEGKLIKGIMYVWCAGVFWKILRGAYLNLQFLYDLRKCSEPYTSKQGIEMLKQAMLETKCQYMPEVYIHEGLESPIQTGILHPKIYLEKNYEARELRLVFLHELTHIKRKDLLFKNLAALMQVIHWFNPVIRMVISRFYDYCEISCDAETAKLLTKDDKISYCRLIACKQVSFHSSVSGMALADSNKHIIYRRVEEMITKKKSSRVAVAGAALALALSCPITATASVWIAKETGVELAKKMEAKYLEEEPLNMENMEEYQYKKETKITYHRSVLRGTTVVDEMMQSGTSYEYGPFELKKGKSVSVALYADNTKSKFKVSLTDSNDRGKTVYSANGEVMHKFTASQDGTYYVEIQNYGSGDAHITGAIIQ